MLSWTCGVSGGSSSSIEISSPSAASMACLSDLRTQGSMNSMPGEESGLAVASSDTGARSGAQTVSILDQVEAHWLAVARRDPATGLPVCGNCNRLGHPLCGLRYQISLRAAWLRVPEEIVAEEPASFEDPGTLQILRQSEIGFVREISEGEAEDLEECLDAVQRPFPQLRRSIPLSQ
ncbi:unnamed protein product, partial [Polarella glacialis]